MGDLSRYKNTPTTLYEGNITYGLWKPLSILKKDIDTDDYYPFTVSSQYEGRPDKISDAVYATSHLDWVLIAYNRVLDPFGWPRAGEIIKIPRSELFMSELIA
jgi:hypothetical protein